MKLFARIAAPVITLGLCIWGDVALGRFLFAQLPEAASWLFWAKLGIVLGIIAVTAGLIFVVTAVVGIITNLLTE